MNVYQEDKPAPALTQVTPLQAVLYCMMPLINPEGRRLPEPDQMAKPKGPNKRTQPEPLEPLAPPPRPALDPEVFDLNRDTMRIDVDSDQGYDRWKEDAVGLAAGRFYDELKLLVRCSFVEMGGKICHMNHGKLISTAKNGLHQLHAVKLRACKELRFPAQSLRDFVLANVVSLEGTILDPHPLAEMDQFRVVDRKWNTWRGYRAYEQMDRYEEVKDSDDFRREMNFYLFMDYRNNCACEQTNFEAWVYWRAFVLQRPDVPTEKLVLLFGDKGCGKSKWVSQFIHYSIGDYNAQTTNNPHAFDGNFFYCTKTFVHAEENHPQTMTTMDSWITPPSTGTEISQKHVDDRTEKLHSNFVASSNLPWPMDVGQRRFLVLQTNDSVATANKFPSSEHGASVAEDFARLDRFYLKYGDCIGPYFMSLNLAQMPITLRNVPEKTFNWAYCFMRHSSFTPEVKAYYHQLCLGSNCDEKSGSGRWLHPHYEWESYLSYLKKYHKVSSDTMQEILEFYGAATFGIEEGKANIKFYDLEVCIKNFLAKEECFKLPDGKLRHVSKRPAIPFPLSISESLFSDDFAFFDHFPKQPPKRPAPAPAAALAEPMDQDDLVLFE